MSDRRLDRLLDDVGDEQRSLDIAVAPLDASQWSTPTPAPGWTVRDQISHLTYFDEQAALARVDPAAYEAGRDAALADLRAFDTAGSHRGAEPGDLLARWRDARRSLRAAFVGVDPKARVPWYGPPMSARSFLTARLMEAWAHGVDVTDALGLPPSNTERLQHVAHLGVVTRGWSYAVRGATVPAEEVHVALVGPNGESWTWGDPDAGASIRGPAVDFCLVVTQRRPLAEVTLAVDGDGAEGWMAIAQAFAGGPTTVERA